MNTFAELEAALEYRFGEALLLQKALTHSSYAHEENSEEDNEQLEFLGDSVLGLLVSDLLFRAHPHLYRRGTLQVKGFFRQCGKSCEVCRATWPRAVSLRGTR